MAYRYFNRTALFMALQTIFIMSASAQIQLAPPLNLDSTHNKDNNNHELESTSTISHSSLENKPSVTLPAVRVIANNVDRSASTTATGLDLSFSDTPKTTSVITEEQIENQQLDNIAELIDRTPGLNTQQLDGSRTQFFARGFEIEEVEIDGLRVSYESQWGEGAEFSSLAIYERAEVVKGADGLMTGSGNPSATVNLIRKQAESTEFTGKASAKYNRYHGYGATLDTESGLTESGNVRGRLILDYTGGDTFIDRENKENRTVYGVINADITNDTSVSIGAMHQDKIQNEVMWGGLPISYTDNTRIDWAPNQSTAVDWGKREGKTDEVFGSIEHDINENWRMNFKANHAKTDGDMKLFYLTGAVDKETQVLQGQSIASYIWQTDTEDTNVSAELNGFFEAFGYQYQAMIGADYNDFKTSSDAQEGVSVDDALYNYLSGHYPEPMWGIKYKNDDYKIKEKAIYGSTHLQMTDELGVVLGARVSDYKLNGLMSERQHNIEHSSEWTPFIGATYQLTENASIFASYTDIFQPQRQRSADGKVLDPIIGKNYEIGIKGTNDANTLHMQLSLFNIEQDNLAQIDPKGGFVEGSVLETAYVQADGATSKGIDIEVTGQLTDNWQGSLGYTDFKVKDSGHKRINTQSPETTLKVFTSYDASDFVEGLTIGGGINWMDDRYVEFANPLDNYRQSKIKEGSVTQVNLMARYEMTDDLDLQVNINNLLDETYINPIGFGQVTNGEPLNVEGKITYRW